MHAIPTYTTPDGLFSLDFDQIGDDSSMWLKWRQLDHVMNNEAQAKVAAARKKAGVDSLPADVEAKIVADARAEYKAKLIANEWGIKGSRAPRATGANRLEQLEKRFTLEATRAKLAKDGTPKGDKPNHFVYTKDGVSTEYHIDVWADSFVKNPEYGAERLADIKAKAAREYEKELAELEASKAAKSREADAPRLEI
jgi:hypothetical protein